MGTGCVEAEAGEGGQGRGQGVADGWWTLPDDEGERVCPLDCMGKVALKRFRESVEVKEIQGVHKWLEQGLGSTVFGEDAGRTGRPLGEERTMVFVALE